MTKSRFADELKEEAVRKDNVSNLSDMMQFCHLHNLGSPPSLITLRSTVCPQEN